MDDFRRITYGVLIGFVLILVLWISFVALIGCGFAANCSGAAPMIDRTAIPTLIPGTLPPPNRALGAATPAMSSNGTGTPQSGTAAAEAESVPRPSNPGGTGPAIYLKGDTATGQLIFESNCQTCHGSQGVGGNPNPGSSEGTIPALNPIHPALKSSDFVEFASNLDLFIEHGSMPKGPNPTFIMLAWGDQNLLTPQEIADVIAYVIQLNQ